jgi:hypothetical protein
MGAAGYSSGAGRGRGDSDSDGLVLAAQEGFVGGPCFGTQLRQQLHSRAILFGSADLSVPLLIRRFWRYPWRRVWSCLDLQRHVALYPVPLPRMAPVLCMYLHFLGASFDKGFMQPNGGAR